MPSHFYKILILLLFSLNSYSQHTVIDSLTKEPIASVHVLYKENKGLITNSDGYFELPNIDIDTVTISHIGYNSIKKYCLNLKKTDTIVLFKNSIELDEVILKKFKSRDSIEKAIRNIDLNYLTNSHNSKGFFRQYLQEDSKGIEMVEVDFTGYFKNRKTNYSSKIEKARRTKNYSKITLNTIGGVQYVLEKGDFVRRRISFLDINKLNLFNYSYEGTVKSSSNDLYKISFKPKNDEDLKNLNLGYIYLDTEFLAFVEINYTKDEDKLKKITKLTIENFDSNKKPLFITEKVNNIIKYRNNNNNKWTLSSVEFSSKSKGIYKNHDYSYNLKGKLVINDVILDNIKKVNTNYNTNKDFSRAIKRFDKTKKWENNFKLSLSIEEQKILEEILSYE